MVIAIVLTAVVFALAIRDVLHPEHTRGLLLQFDYVLHGFLLIGANIAFYAYLCWLAFRFIHGTRSRERAVMIGWFASVLLTPLEHFRPEWALTIRFISMFGLLIALLAAVTILLRSQEPSTVDGAG